MSFATFLAFDIWKIGGSLSYFFLYFLLYTVYRLIAMPIGALFVLKDKLKALMVTGYVFMVILAVYVLVGYSIEDNILLIINIYAMPLAFFTTFFYMGMNQYIVQSGKDEYYERFFYLVGVWKNIVDVLMPIALGVVITLISYKLSFTLMIIISFYSIYKILKMEDVYVGLQGETLKDIFKVGTSTVPKRVTYIHYLFVFVSGSLLQYLDMGLNIYQFILGEDALKVGILKSLFVGIIFIVYKIKSMDKMKDSSWYYWSLMFVVVMILFSVFMTGILVNYIILLLLVILSYIINNSSLAISFKLVGDQDNFSKFSMLFKRELVRTFAKMVVAFVGILISFDTVESLGYKIYSLSMLVVLLVVFITYREVDKYAEKINIARK